MSKYIVRITRYVNYEAEYVEASSSDEAIEKVKERGLWDTANREVNFDVEEL